jgi:CubicO group peptidase (beta-lactamase class C family)
MIKNFIVFIFLFVNACGIYAQDWGEFEKWVEKTRVQWKVPGVAVAVVQGDKVVFIKGFGVRQIDQSGPVDPETIFQLASVSKAFTAAGLGVGVDRGLLKWDEEIIKNLPQFALQGSYPTRFATARDLLAHRTGLPAFRGDLLGKMGYSSQEILYRVRFIEPATSFRNLANYSNVGFFVAGELLGKIFNTSWEKAISTQLFIPLQMQRSGFKTNLDQQNVAAPHAVIDGKIAVIALDRTGGFPGADGITSTAADMARFMIMHLNGGVFQGKSLLKQTTVQEIFAPSMVSEVSFTEAPPINPNASFSYGLGWGNYNYNGFMIVEKGGALDGVRTNVTLVPELKLGICILSNLNLTLLPEVIRAKFLERYLGKSRMNVEAEFQKMEKPIENLFKIEPKPPNALPPSHSLEQYTGVFESTLYGLIKIRKENEELILEAGPALWKGRLLPWSNDTFSLLWPTINSGHEQVTFMFGPDNRAIEIQTETLGTFRRKKS